MFVSVIMVSVTTNQVAAWQSDRSSHLYLSKEIHIWWRWLDSIHQLNQENQLTSEFVLVSKLGIWINTVWSYLRDAHISQDSRPTIYKQKEFGPWCVSSLRKQRRRPSHSSASPRWGCSRGDLTYCFAFLCLTTFLFGPAPVCREQSASVARRCKDVGDPESYCGSSGTIGIVTVSGIGIHPRRNQT